jgi:hypothetical protein
MWVAALFVYPPPSRAVQQCIACTACVSHHNPLVAGCNESACSLLLLIACYQCVLLGGQRSCLSCTMVAIYLCQVWGCLAHAAYRITSFEAQGLERFATLSCYCWGMRMQKSTGVGQHAHTRPVKKAVHVSAYVFLLNCVKQHSGSACCRRLSISIFVCSCSLV